MKKYCLLIISLIILPTVYFSSCAKVEDDETENPKIHYGKMNINDTVSYYENGKRINIKINDSTKVKSKDEAGRDIDTLIVTKMMYVSVQLTDNDRLSTFKTELMLRYKDKKGLAKDSILRIMRLGENIFGQKEAVIYRNKLVVIPDTLIRINTNGKQDTLGLYLQEDGRGYEMKISCIDKSGNLDTLGIPLHLFYRKDLVNAIKNKK